MGELCANCPVIECQNKLKTKIDTPYKRLGEAWLAFSAIDRSLTRPFDAQGPKVETFEDTDEDTNEVVTEEVTRCCSDGLIGSPDVIADLFGDPLTTGMPGHDGGGDTYSDSSFYVVDGSLVKVTRTPSKAVPSMFIED